MMTQVSMRLMPNLTQTQPFEDLLSLERFRLLKSFCDIISICLRGREWGNTHITGSRIEGDRHFTTGMCTGIHISLANLVPISKSLDSEIWVRD